MHVAVSGMRWIVEEKYYARGVGLILERGVKGASGRSELIDVTESG